MKSINLKHIALFQLVMLLLLWIFYPSTFFPKPLEIYYAFIFLCTKFDLLSELINSFSLILHAMFISVICTATIAYATKLPIFKISKYQIEFKIGNFMLPLSMVISKMRYLSLLGLSFFFTLMTSSGHDLKLYLMIFGISTYMLTSMLDIVNDENINLYYYAKTLGFSEYKILFENTILGKIPLMLDAIKQNFAIGLVMLTAVEGLVRSEGGIGALLLNQAKYLKLDAVFAIQITIFLTAFLIDYLFTLIKDIACPYLKYSSK